MGHRQGTLASATLCAMIKLELFLSVAAFAVWIYCLVDVIHTRDDEVRSLTKSAWIPIVFFGLVPGAIGWVLFGRPPTAPQGPRGHESIDPPLPELDGLGRVAAVDQVSHEVFLERVRARAEEQRRRYAEQQEREQQSPEAG
jgi:hypothetical protein